MDIMLKVRIAVWAVVLAFTLCFPFLHAAVVGCSIKKLRERLLLRYGFTAERLALCEYVGFSGWPHPVYGYFCTMLIGGALLVFVGIRIDIATKNVVFQTVGFVISTCAWIGLCMFAWNTVYGFAIIEGAAMHWLSVESWSLRPRQALLSDVEENGVMAHGVGSFFPGTEASRRVEALVRVRRKRVVCYLILHDPEGLINAIRMNTHKKK